MASLDEGLEETLTLHHLGVFRELGTSLKTTNALESIHARVESRIAKVDHWKNSEQKAAVVGHRIARSRAAATPHQELPSAALAACRIHATDRRNEEVGGVNQKVVTECQLRMALTLQPTQEQTTLYYSQREYLLPTMNRGQVVRLAYLNAARSEHQPTGRRLMRRGCRGWSDHVNDGHGSTEHYSRADLTPPRSSASGGRAMTSSVGCSSANRASGMLDQAPRPIRLEAPELAG